MAGKGGDELNWWMAFMIMTSARDGLHPPQLGIMTCTVSNYPNIVVSSSRGKQCRIGGVKVNRVDRLLVMPMNLHWLCLHVLCNEKRK